MLATIKFNAYDTVTEKWTTTPANMVDGDVDTYAQETVKAVVQKLTGNDCAGVDLGKINSVVMRVKAAVSAWPTSPVSYQYNAGTSVWSTNPTYMWDGDEATYAQTSTNHSTQIGTGNTCPGKNLGTITKVEIRVKSNNYNGGYTNKIGLRPYFGGAANGTEVQHNVGYPGSYQWSSWQDITTDTNAPGTWTWADVVALDVKVQSHYDDYRIIGGMVEVRVTFTPPTAENAIILRPVFAAGDGDNHNVSCNTTPAYCSNIDITGDTNAPTPWTWAAIAAMDMDVVANLDAADAVCAYEVEFIVDYEPILQPQQYRIELRNRNFDLVKMLTKQAKNPGWDFDRIGGCGIGTIEIAASELINIAPDYDVQIYLENFGSSDCQLVYRGYVNGYRPVIDAKDSVFLDVIGYVWQLCRARVNETFENKEVSVIIKEILDDYILPNTKIIYDAADIEDTGYTVDSITFDELADGAIKQLADLAGAFEWGVDRDRKFYFKRRYNDIRHYIRHGKNVKKFDALDDYDALVNRLVIKCGGDLEVTVNNAESQTAYGLRTGDPISLSSVTTTGVATRYGTSVLAEKARINRKITAKVADNTQFFEETVPLGKVAFIGTQIAQAKKYGDDDAIYGAFKYGGTPSMQIERISYKVTQTGTEITLNAGYARPDIAEEIKRIDFQINQIRNA